MRILFLGDVVGEPGRRILRHHLARVVEERDVAFVVANGENVAGGVGITPALLEKLRSYGVDVVTTGDHVYRRREIYEALDSSEHIVRPLNLPVEAVGHGSTVVSARNGVPVGVVNLLGRVYMDPIDCPFAAVERELVRIEKRARVILVDVHAEATSEKVAMGWFLAGRVAAVVGSHTHVPTADERILPGGTAYVTDLGMTGPHESVLGRQVSHVVKRFRTGMPIRFPVAERDRRATGVLVDVDEATGQARAIERVTIRDP
jgi:metallophosphoesterase (TIGR00282 family)